MINFESFLRRNPRLQREKKIDPNFMAAMALGIEMTQEIKKLRDTNGPLIMKADLRNIQSKITAISRLLGIERQKT